MGKPDLLANSHGSTGFNSGNFLVLAILGLLLYVGRAAFAPVALALLFSLVLSGPVEALHKFRIPRNVSAALILILVLSLMAGVVNLMWAPSQEWFAKAPQTMALIKHKLSPVASFMIHIDDLRKNAASIGIQGRTQGGSQPVAVVAGQSASALILDATSGSLAGISTFVIVTLFLLAGGPPMLARMTAAFVDNLNVSYVIHILEKLRAEVGRFYITTTLINVGLGFATAAAMTAWGMPTAYLWGIVAAVLNYIPYAGAAMTLILLTVVAIVSFNSLSHVFGVAATYGVLALIEGQIVQPLLIGRRLDVNPLLIFLGLWFGGLFWGISGVILATPMLVALKVIAENTESGAALMEFLGPNGQTPDRVNRLRQLARRARRVRVSE